MGLLIELHFQIFFSDHFFFLFFILFFQKLNKTNKQYSFWVYRERTGSEEPQGENMVHLYLSVCLRAGGTFIPILRSVSTS